MPVRRMLFAVPEAENSSGKGGIVDDGVESGRAAIARISVARSDRTRRLCSATQSLSSETSAAAICALMVTGAPGDGIQAVGAERLIKRVIHVDAAEMAVAGPAEIGGANFVRLKNADGRGPHEKSVVVVMDARVVLVVVNAELASCSRA